MQEKIFIDRVLLSFCPEVTAYDTSAICPISHPRINLKSPQAHSPWPIPDSIHVSSRLLHNPSTPHRMLQHQLEYNFLPPLCPKVVAMT